MIITVVPCKAGSNSVDMMQDHCTLRIHADRHGGCMRTCIDFFLVHFWFEDLEDFSGLSWVQQGHIHIH